MRKRTVSLLPLFLLLSGCFSLSALFNPADLAWEGGGYFSKFENIVNDMSTNLIIAKFKDFPDCSFTPRNYLATYRCMRAKGYYFHQRGPYGDYENICRSGLLNEAEKKEMCHNVLGHELLYMFHP